MKTFQQIKYELKTYLFEEATKKHHLLTGGGAFYMAQYQSGHNGAVLKTVVAFIRPVGSNPTCAANTPYHNGLGATPKAWAACNATGTYGDVVKR